jgi:hypothetical protein
VGWVPARQHWRPIGVVVITPGQLGYLLEGHRLASSLAPPWNWNHPRPKLPEYQHPTTLVPICDTSPQRDGIHIASGLDLIAQRFQHIPEIPWHG